MNTLVLCLKIFFARIFDVTLGTTRMILTVKEKRVYAMIVGFIEVTVWFLVAKEAITNAGNSLYVVFSYAGGYAVGTFVGSFLSSKIIDGKLKVQVITQNNDLDVLDKIKDAGFGVSAIPTHDNKLMLIIEVDKKHYPKLKKLIDKIDDKAFISVNETKYVEKGYFQKK